MSVEADSLPIYKAELPVRGTMALKDPMSVLIGELVNEVLTWEEMDSYAVQAYQD
jgi:hypothetical protein